MYINTMKDSVMLQLYLGDDLYNSVFKIRRWL